MILVRHAMTVEPKSLSAERTAVDAAGLMEQLDIGVIPVIGEDGGLFGVVTDRDLVLRVVAKGKDPHEVTLADVATTRVVTISPDANISKARDLMAEHKVRRLPVVKDGELVGILALGDVAVADESKRAVGRVLDEVSESPSTTELNEGPARGTPERVRG